MNQHTNAPFAGWPRRIIRRLTNVFRQHPSRFTSSAEYWEDRYSRNGNSGPGSHNRLAVFKAQVLNYFVAQHNITSVIEFGSGDGAQLEMAEYPKYVGVDVSQSALRATRKRFAEDSRFSFMHTSEISDGTHAELSLSIDVIYHLVEDEVFDAYMAQLFDAATKFVIIYSSNEDKSWPDPHVRHRQFTRWIDANRPQFELVEFIPNEFPYSEDDPANTSFADFFVFSRVWRVPVTESTRF